MTTWTLGSRQTVNQYLDFRLAERKAVQAELDAATATFKAQIERWAQQNRKVLR